MLKMAAKFRKSCKCTLSLSQVLFILSNEMHHLGRHHILTSVKVFPFLFKSFVTSVKRR